ncbi:MAG: tRNA lysidine(34) synthetase TilS [Clostridiaceae bacterium]|nr:tRNA lysidine(34) synthetase TilS [Eubacteriales bacterium]
MQNKAAEAIWAYGLIGPGQTVVCGVSGGADSVALLKSLLSLSTPMEFKVCAAHLNHGIRGESAEHDEQFVRDLCEFYGVPFYSERADIPALAKKHKLTVEQAGREERYAFLERARLHFNADLIAVAHHMNDQAESILLHMTRGSGLSGLTGMQPKRDRIIRPLLFVRRDEIEEYLSREGLAYCIDETNFEPDGTRNRIRLDILPYIEKHINPAIVPTLCSMAELLLRDEKYLGAQAEEALSSCKRDGGYDRRALQKLPLPLLTRAIRLALKNAGAEADIERVHVEKVIAFLKARTGARLHLPFVEAWTSYDLIQFGVTEELPEFQMKLNVPGETVTPLGTFVAELVDGGGFLKDKTVACMDLAKLDLDALSVRTRKDGDRFYPVGSPGRRKLKQYFIDKKVPRDKRNLPLICASEVLFVPGHAVSEAVKVDGHTAKTLRVKFLGTKI